MTISQKQGRSLSRRTKAELAAALETELKSLTPEERETLQLMMEEMRKPEEVQGPKLFDALAQAEYKHRPVSMAQFMEDPYYLGEACGNLYKQHKKDLIELFDGGYQEAIWTGAIGIGKTFVASVGICRILYELSCMKSPQKSFGLAENTGIAIASLSVNEGLAIKVVLENIATKILPSPYFKENYPFEILKKEIKFPNNVWVAARASTDTSVLGLNVISAIIDESNFFNKGKGAKAGSEYIDRAESIYNQLKRRMKSRFERRGKLPGILFLLSSKQTLEDFTNRRIVEARENNDPSVFVRDYSLWEIRPESYLGARFHVLVGNEATYSRVLEDHEVAKYKAELPDGTMLIEVPEDFRKDFENDIDGSLRDIAGVATVAITPYIQNRAKINEAIDPNRKHPFSTLAYDASKGGGFLWHEMVRPVHADQPSFIGGATAKKSVPIVNPGAPRHIHIDPSYRGDAAGICMSHIMGWKNVERRAPDGALYSERAPVYYVDFILKVLPPIGGEIILADFRQIVYDLSANGYVITSVSMDSWQSVDAVQMLSSQGYNAVYQSVDKKMDAYDNLKTALYENRVIAYDYPALTNELRKLQIDWIKRKVDHPQGGCFVGETRIPTLDGKLPTIAELEGKETWVYSTTPNGKIVPGKARGRLTKYTSELVDVVLDSGAVERCTPEHKWMLRDGTYKEAQHLRPGIDRLMPIRRTWPVNGGYERLTDLHGDRVLTHHMVVEALQGPIPDGYCVHHRNHSKIDNTPDNLELAPLREHARLHTALRHATDVEWQNKLRAGAKAFNESPRGRKIHSEALKRTTSRMTRADRVKRARQNTAFRSDITLRSLEGIKRDPEATNANAAARILNCGRNVVMRILNENSFRSWEEFVQSESGLNHKVRAVIPVTLETPVPVYDLEVDKYSNFSLASEVVVHNSKDCADALAGCLFTLSASKTHQPLPFVASIPHYPGMQTETNIVPVQETSRPQGETATSSYNMLPPFLIGNGSDPTPGSGFGFGG